MPAIFEQIRDALDAYEPDYRKAAATFGPEALPHLERLIASDHPLLPSKATFMVGLIGAAGSPGVLRKAANSTNFSVRVAAAAAAGNLHPEAGSPILLRLVDDENLSVRKVALKSTPMAASAVLRERIRSISIEDHDKFIRSVAYKVLEQYGW